VEFAVLAPLLFLLIFGMIEYGRMIMVQQMITNAAREGARVAILEGETEDSVKTLVKDRLAEAVPLEDSDIVITPDNFETATGGTKITVAVGINFDQISWLPQILYLGNTRLTATSSMRKESVN
jgi:Flp pilus assembly protein TadG